MIVLEFKLKGKAEQYQIIDEMIRTAQFVRNKTLRYWTENQGVKLVDLYKQCAIMAKEFEWASKLNSTARQASAERAIFAIQRFFANCKAKKTRKKGIPTVQETYSFCRVQTVRLGAFYRQKMLDIQGRLCCRKV